MFHGVEVEGWTRDLDELGVWLGVALWSDLHFIRSLARGLRASLIERVGEAPYKIVFSLGVIGSIALMVVGWRSTNRLTYRFPRHGGILLAVRLFSLPSFCSVWLVVRRT